MSAAACFHTNLERMSRLVACIPGWEMAWQPPQGRTTVQRPCQHSRWQELEPEFWVCPDVSRLLSHISCLSLLFLSFSALLSPIIRPLSASCILSVSQLLSVLCLQSVLRLMSHVSCPLSPVSRQLFHISCLFNVSSLTFPASRLLSVSLLLTVSHNNNNNNNNRLFVSALQMTKNI